MINLSNNEYRVMEVFWKEQRSITRAEILERMKQCENWNPASINMVMSKLLKKGYIKAVNSDYIRLYDALVSRDDYTAEYVVNGTPGRKNKERLFSVVSGLIKSDIDDEDIEALKKMLEDRKQRRKET